MMGQHKYVYDGPVEAFGRCISLMWSGETTAPTMEKARANLMHQCKKKYNMAPNCSIKLVGKIYRVGQKEETHNE